MASLMKTAVSLPLRFPSSLFLPLLLLLFLFLVSFFSFPLLFCFFVFSIRFCFSPICHYSSPLIFLSLPFFFLLWFLCIISLSLSSIFHFFLPVSVSLFSIFPLFFFFSPPTLSFALFLPLLPQNPPPCSVFPLPFLSFMFFVFISASLYLLKKSPLHRHLSSSIYKQKERETTLPCLVRVQGMVSWGG